MPSRARTSLGRSDWRRVGRVRPKPNTDNGAVPVARRIGLAGQPSHRASDATYRRRTIWEQELGASGSRQRGHRVVSGSATGSGSTPVYIVLVGIPALARELAHLDRRRRGAAKRSGISFLADLASCATGCQAVNNKAFKFLVRAHRSVGDELDRVRPSLMHRSRAFRLPRVLPLARAELPLHIRR